MYAFIIKLFIGLFFGVALYGQIGEHIAVEEIADNIWHNYYSRWHINEKQYTPGQSPAGVTFSYPENWFSMAPYVVVSVRKDDQAADTLVSPVVVSNSSTAARILVVVAAGDPLALSEADDTYYVTLYAIY